MNNVYSKVAMWGDEMSPSISSLLKPSYVIADGAELLLPLSLDNGNIMLVPKTVKIPCEGKVTIEGNKTCLWNAFMKIGMVDVNFLTLKGKITPGMGKIWFLPVMPSVLFTVGGSMS